MHRTEGSNYDEVAGKKYFSNGPPGTLVEEDWLNTVQEEICNIIETAGITLDVSSTDGRDQLLAALQNSGLDLAFKELALAGDLTLATGKGLLGSDGSPALAVASDGVMTASENIKMAAGKGISFSPYTPAGVIASQTLDDYEEGTWTMAFTTSVSGAINIHPDSNKGYYTKIGRVVHVQGFPVCASISTAGVGELLINLPFVVNALTENAGNIAFALTGQSLTGMAAGDSIHGRTIPGSAAFYLKGWNGDTIIDALANNVQETTQLGFGFSYIV